MKIAITADSHFDSRPNGRFDECVRIHEWMAEDWRKRGVQLALWGGDIYERRSTASERMAVAEHVLAVGEFAHQVIIRGNHDDRFCLSLLEKLETRHPIRVLEHADVVSVQVDGEEFGSVGGHYLPGDRVLIACQPWPEKAGVLKAAAKLGLGIEGAELIVHEALQHVLRGLGNQMDEMDPDRKLPRIMLSHAMVDGSVTSTGQPIWGQSMRVSLDDLRLARADIYALGHIHRSQEWSIISEPGRATIRDVFYTGSPRRTAFGELETKSYVLYDTDTNTWERIETPCTPMILLDWEWAQRIPGDDETYQFMDAADFYVDKSTDRAEIRLRYKVSADRRAEAAFEAESIKHSMIAGGAKSVILDPVTITVSTTKAPEIALAHTVGDKLTALWKHRNENVSPEREARIMGKLAEIEIEVG